MSNDDGDLVAIADLMCLIDRQLRSRPGPGPEPLPEDWLYHQTVLSNWFEPEVALAMWRDEENRPL